jgi:hypothetical protein
MSHDTRRSSSHLSRRAALGVGATAAVSLRQYLPAAAQGATPATQATPSAADTALADLIRTTERERLAAFVAADMAVIDRLTADDFQLINPAGGTVSRAAYLGGISSGFLDYVVWEPTSAIAVRLYGEAAAIRYQSHTELVIAGGALPPLSVWHTDLYEHRDGTWQVVWSHATAVEE